MVPERVDQAARREEIRSSAIRVLSREGFAVTKGEDRAAEVALMAERTDHLSRSALQPHRPAVERLTGLLRSTVELWAEQPDLARVLTDLWAAERTPAPAGTPDMTAVYRTHRAVVIELLREGVREGDLRPGAGPAEAAVLIGAIEGCLVQWLIDPSVPLTELSTPIIGACLSDLRDDRARGPGSA